MFSISIEENIIKKVSEIDINLLMPHEKIVSDKKEILKNNLKYKDDYCIISSIIACKDSNVIIDGHHRYFALKELGIKKIPVTVINYFSDKIKTDENNYPANILIPAWDNCWFLHFGGLFVLWKKEI